jgi:hypothetical protein
VVELRSTYSVPYIAGDTQIQELLMKTFRRAQLVIVAALLVAPSAFAQAPQKPDQTQHAKKQATQDGNSPTTVGPGSKAYKQKTQGDLPEVGPASGAYSGNSLKSKY